MRFFDSTATQIGSDQIFSYSRPSGDGVLEWHGWNSATPIKSLTIGAQSLVLDGVQATPVPEPAEWGVACASAAGLFALVLRQSRKSSPTSA